jgi:hypothetical protein
VLGLLVLIRERGWRTVSQCEHVYTIRLQPSSPLRCEYNFRAEKKEAGEEQKENNIKNILFLSLFSFHRKLVASFLLFACHHGQRCHQKTKKNLEPLTTTDENVEKVLVNGVAEIKCDVSSSIDGDQVLLVVWYKNNLPIYR